jgi:segregation and condensation protein A
MYHGEGVQIDDAVERLDPVLLVDPALERAQVVAEVDRAGGLDTAENPCHSPGTLLSTEPGRRCIAGLTSEVVAVDVTTSVFEGPFDLLLHLILREQVDLYEVSLSHIVDVFLAELAKLDSIDLDLTTEFLLIAATLVELKARRLLPGREDIDLDEELALFEERDLLLSRLLECKTFKDVARVLSGLADVAARSYPRVAGLDERYIELAPDPLEGLNPKRLLQAYLRATTPKPVPKVDLFHVNPIRLTVAEAVEELADELSRAGRMSFRRLTEGLGERLEIIVRFLALLEMYKQGSVDLSQHDHFGEIDVIWLGTDQLVGAASIDDYEG